MLYDPGSSNSLEQWERVEGGREVQEGGVIYTPMANSCQYMAAIKPILYSNYPSIKNEFLKEK